MSCRKLLRAFWRDLDTNDVLGLSAQMSFYFVVSIFPFFILVAAVANALTFTQAWNSILAWFLLYLPAQIRHLVFVTIASLTGPRNQFLTIGLVGTIRAATGGIMNLMAALNVVYNVKERRSYFWRVTISCLILIVLTSIFLVLFVSLTMGDLADARLATLLNSPHSLLWLWKIGRWMLSFIFTALAVSIIDNVLPNHHRRLWRWVPPGSCFTVAAWLAAEAVFNFYLSRFGSYQRNYGVFGTFVVLMLWIYVMSLIVLVGAEINSLIRNWKAGTFDRTASEANR